MTGKNANSVAGLTHWRRTREHLACVYRQVQAGALGFRFNLARVPKKVFGRAKIKNRNSCNCIALSDLHIDRFRAVFELGALPGVCERTQANT